MIYQWSKRKAIVHTARCRWARRIKPGNLEQARDLEQALTEGRRGCRLCKPGEAPTWGDSIWATPK